jgi:hypothetical protein
MKMMKSNIALMLFLILFVIANCALFTNDNDDNKIVYITPQDLKRYHNYDCKALDTIKNNDSKKIISMKKNDAKAKNLQACIICNP